MKSWPLNKRINKLNQGLANPPKTDTVIDWRCFTQPELELMEKVQEIQEKYPSGLPPKDIIEKNADLWYKGLEIFRRRTTELFVETIPITFCCDELEEWYFKLHFYNFCLDFQESLEKLRELSKEKHDEILLERKEMGMLDYVFRFPDKIKKTNTKRQIIETTSVNKKNQGSDRETKH